MPPLRSSNLNFPVGDEEEPKYAALNKMADAGALQGIGDLISKYLFETPQGTPTFSSGDYATSVWGMPTFLPLAMLGSAGSLYGGYKLTDKLLDMRRKAELQNQLEDAQEDYERAVQQRLKVAEHVDETPELDLLDELAVDGVQKQAQGNVATNLGGGLASLYLAYALLTGLGSGILTHNVISKNAPRKITEKALQTRARQRYGMTPPLYISSQEDEPEPQQPL
jgi:hypothetical protein